MKKRPAPPSLNVRWHDGRLVGRVITTGPTYFAYDEEWLATSHSLSPLSVPFTNATFRQRADGFDQLPGFLADCLPDQWGRRLMDRMFKEHDLTATPMRMLTWVGHRAIGALQFEPTLDEIHSSSTWSAATPLLLAREAQAVMRQEPAATFQHLQQAGTAGGALPKATVALFPDGTLLVGGDVAAAAVQNPQVSLGLLKLDCEDAPFNRSTDGRMEHAYMHMAQVAGIRAAATKVLIDESGSRPRHHLFVHRFDCSSTSPRRLHLLTLAGALHSHHLDYRNLLLTTRQLTQDHHEVLEATRRMIFNVRTGNADDHGKNHSFLYDEDKRCWSLSPAYDLTLNFSDARDYHGLFPATFGSSPRLATLAAVAADAGVNQKEFARLDAEVTVAVNCWPQFAHAASAPDSEVARAVAVLQQLEASLALEVTTQKAKRRKLW